METEMFDKPYITGVTRAFDTYRIELQTSENVHEGEIVGERTAKGIIRLLAKIAFLEAHTKDLELIVTMQSQVIQGLKDLVKEKK